MMCGSGLSFGWSGPTLIYLQSNTSDFPIHVTSEEGSWLAGVLSLGGILGPIFASVCADYFGRKVSILLNTLPFLIAWIMIGTATTVANLYIAQFLAGIAAGACFTIVPMYVGEVSSPEIRGILSTFMSMQFNLGILIEYALVPYVSMATNAIVAGSFSVVLLITFIWMPESPYYYIMRNEDAKAMQELSRIRCTENVQFEFETLKLSMKKEMSSGKLSDLFRMPSNRLALYILFGLITAQEFSGLTAIIAYAQTIFAKADSFISPEVSGVIYASASFGVIVICSLLVDMWGRRPLMITSACTTAIMLIVIGGYFYLQSIGFQYIKNISLVPVIATIMYKMTFGVGLGPLPYVCLGEFFPTNVKAFAACLLSIYGSLAGFIVAKLYQIMSDSFGTHNVFFFFAACCVLGALFTYFIMPETKGKSLEEIQAELKKRAGSL